eukprot:gene23787-9347_t
MPTGNERPGTAGGYSWDSKYANLLKEKIGENEQERAQRQHRILADIQTGGFLQQQNQNNDRPSDPKPAQPDKFLREHEGTGGREAEIWLFQMEKYEVLLTTRNQSQLTEEYKPSLIEALSSNPPVPDTQEADPNAVYWFHDNFPAATPAKRQDAIAVRKWAERQMESLKGAVHAGSSSATRAAEAAKEIQGKGNSKIGQLSDNGQDGFLMVRDAEGFLSASVLVHQEKLFTRCMLELCGQLWAAMRQMLHSVLADRESSRNIMRDARRCEQTAADKAATAVSKAEIKVPQGILCKTLTGVSRRQQTRQQLPSQRLRFWLRTDGGQDSDCSLKGRDKSSSRSILRDAGRCEQTAADKAATAVSKAKAEKSEADQMCDVLNRRLLNARSDLEASKAKVLELEGHLREYSDVHPDQMRNRIEDLEVSLSSSQRACTAAIVRFEKTSKDLVERDKEVEILHQK